ncbi:MAG: glycosyltransferase [Mycobacteriales bacterium]
MATAPPSVSVVLATYNGERFIGEQLASLAAQTQLPAELIVGDDLSEDATLDVVTSFATTAPFPVHIQVNALTLGYAENFLQLASRATGSLVAFADQDDVWLPDKLAAVSLPFAQPEVMLTVHQARLVGASLEPSGGRREVHSGLVTRFLFASPWFVPHGSRSTWRRSLLLMAPTSDRPLSVYAERGPRPQDHDEWAYFAGRSLGRVELLPAVHSLWRRHDRALGFGHDQGRPQRRREWLQPPSAEQQRHLIVVARDRAKYLRRHADRLAATCPDSANRLRAAAESYESLLRAQQRRLHLYDASRRGVRTWRLATTAAAGAYRAQRIHGLGWLALAQDIAALGSS